MARRFYGLYSRPCALLKMATCPFSLSAFLLKEGTTFGWFETDSHLIIAVLESSISLINVN